MTAIEQAVENVRALALKNWHAKPNQRWAFANDASTFTKAKGARKPTVLIAIANQAGSLVLAMDESEWSGTGGEEPAWQMMLDFMGFKTAAPADAMERATEAAAELPKKKR